MNITDNKLINECKELAEKLINVNLNLVNADSYALEYENDSTPYILYMREGKILGNVKGELLNYSDTELQQLKRY